VGKSSSILKQEWHANYISVHKRRQASMENLKGKEHLEDRSVDGKILEWSVRK
jgi:hypothetical protein